MPEGVPLLGFVGHLVDQKRPERAVEVLAGVVAAGRTAHLVVAGGGPLEPVLEDVVARRGLEGSVSLLGHRDDVERILAGVDLLLLTSEAEGIPGVAIEALMAGCPVVTVPVGSVAEVVEDGVTGVVMPTADPAAMAATVVGLLEDDAARARMSEEARRRTARFSAATTARAYEAHLAALVADGGRAPGARWPRTAAPPATMSHGRPPSASTSPERSSSGADGAAASAAVVVVVVDGTAPERGRPAAAGGAGGVGSSGVPQSGPSTSTPRGPTSFAEIRSSQVSTSVTRAAPSVEIGCVLPMTTRPSTARSWMVLPEAGVSVTLSRK